MKIESTGKPLGSVQTADARPKPAAGTPPPSGGDKVELSSLSSSLQKAEAAMANTPVSDKSRVDEIKLAISEGRFKIDANRIADGLIDSVRGLLDGQARS